MECVTSHLGYDLGNTSSIILDNDIWLTEPGRNLLENRFPSGFRKTLMDKVVSCYLIEVEIPMTFAV